MGKHSFVLAEHAMKVRDIVGDGSRIFVKSEWAPLSDEWPAVSFGKLSVGKFLRQQYRRNTDLIVFVGTSDSKKTKDERHRKRLLSAMRIDPSRILDTKKLVHAETWSRFAQEFPGRWPHSMAVLEGWEVEGYPQAHEVIPETYALLGKIENFGQVLEVLSTERDAVLGISVRPLNLKLTRDGAAIVGSVVDAPELLKKEIGRMFSGIMQRVSRTNTAGFVTYSEAISEPEMHELLFKKWNDQDGHCALCGGKITLNGNPLLQPSPDRIDCTNRWYCEGNLSIVHLACSLAKNDKAVEQFEEWLDVVRGDTPPYALDPHSKSLDGDMTAE